MRHSVRAVLTSSSLVLLLSAALCQKPTEAPIPGSLVLVQGNLQLVQGGLELPNPVVVRLLDALGAPIARYPIGFLVVAGGGAVNPGSLLSDENGEARVKWVLGPNEMTQTLQARVPGLEPLAIGAFALLPSDLVVAQGNFQTAKAAAGLPNPVVIRVLGPNNTPMKGIPVAFQVTGGGGLISPQSAITNALGEVTARWTLGSAPGANTLAVSSGSLQAITLVATGT
ncbi:MAG: hypothetical protein ACT4OZ_12845 [Gemmatimonadota bacterium]